MRARTLGQMRCPLVLSKQNTLHVALKGVVQTENIRSSNKGNLRVSTIDRLGEGRVVSPLCGALCALSLGVHHQGLGVDKGPEKTCFPKSIASSLIQPFSDLSVEICGEAANTP